jgi:hypothetical protein
MGPSSPPPTRAASAAREKGSVLGFAVTEFAEPTEFAAQPQGGLWLPIGEMARMRGIGAPAMSERVAKLEAQGLIRVRPGKGRVRLVNVAEFDRATGQATDVTKLLGAETRKSASAPSIGHQPSDPSAPVYSQEHARLTALRADAAALDMQERLGKLVSVERIADAATACAEIILRCIDVMPSHAEEVAAAVAKNGVDGARIALRGIVRDIRTSCAEALKSLGDAGAAPGEASDGLAIDEDDEA